MQKPRLSENRIEALEYAVVHLNAIADDMTPDSSWPAEHRKLMQDAITYLTRLTEWYRDQQVGDED